MNKTSSSMSRLSRQSERCFRSASLIFSKGRLLREKQFSDVSAKLQRVPIVHPSVRLCPALRVLRGSSPRKTAARAACVTSDVHHQSQTRDTFLGSRRASPLPSFPRPTSTDCAESLSASPNWSRVCTRCISHRGIARQRSLNTEQARISLPNPKIPRFIFRSYPYNRCPNSPRVERDKVSTS